MREKVYGLVVSKIYLEDSANVIKYINRYAHKQNCGVVTFAVASDITDGNEVEITDCFYMINYDKIDGIIIDAEFLNGKALVQDIAKKSKMHGKPCVVLNYELEDAVNIVAGDTDSFSDVLRHLIGCHDARKIDLVLESNSSQKYIDIYRQIFEREGLPFENKRISDSQNYETLFESEIPDAVICECDETAFSMIDMLNGRGIRVPEDVLVVGISGDATSNFRKPGLATVIRDRKEMCEMAVNAIYDLCNGKSIQNTFEYSTTPHYAKSCGCKDNGVYDLYGKCSRYVEYFYTNVKYNTKLCSIAERILPTQNISEISEVVESAIPDNAIICIKDSFMQDLFHENENSSDISLNDKFFVLAGSEKICNKWTSFTLGDFIPGFDKFIEKDIPILVLPISYQNNHYGFIIFNDEEYDYKMYAYIRYAYSVQSAFGRYVVDRKMKFAYSELSNANESLKLLKERDVVTGLYNSVGFINELRKLKQHCIDENEILILSCFDIAGLGDINDVFGHSEGDTAIQILASILSDCISENDICGHIGSDEFIVATHTDKEPEDVMEALFRLINGAMDNFNAISSKDYKIELNESYLSVKPVDDTNLQQLMDDTFAKKRMIKQSRTISTSQKKDVKNDEVTAQQRKTVNDIIDDNKFVYAYQPIVNARTGDIYAYEALMRTKTEEFVSPLLILTVAAMDNRLYEVEYNTFFNVLKQCEEQYEKFAGKKVFINSIPGYMLNENDYSKLQRKYAALFDNMVIEITEQTELDDDSLEKFKLRSEELGYEIAIDDFGSGYSNTTNLLRYIPNYVKIDRLLITNVNDDPKRQHFVKNIIDFAHDNGFMALAEGVETEAEMKTVINMGVDLIQGYYTSKPNLEVAKAIPKEISDMIIACNIANKSISKKKVYVVSDEKELILMRLALEEYTDIVIPSTEIRIVGNVDYSAEMHIKIKDNCKATVYLKTSNLKGIDDLPCIDIGNNSELTLVLEDKNKMTGNGIRVPVKSKLILGGLGDLKVSCDDTFNYAIGNHYNESFGNIELGSDGEIEISMIGDECIAIGGGNNKGGFIEILRGKYSINLAGLKCLGFGAVTDMINVELKECCIEISLNALECVGAGALNGEYFVKVENSKIDITGEGKKYFCGIGCIEGKRGKVDISCAHVSIDGSGENVFLAANGGNESEFVFANARIDLSGIGTNIVGVGSYDMTGKVHMTDGLININFETENPIPFGASEDNSSFVSIVKQIKIAKSE